MTYTLLELVQLLLSAMDSDEVNSIDDTVESYQVALLLKQVFYDMMVDLALPEHETLFELDASEDPDQPVLMTVPSNCTKLRNIKYNYQLSTEDYKNYQPVEYKPFEDFLEMQTMMREETDDVAEMTFSLNDETFEVLYRTGKMPEWYTTMDDSTIIFDSILLTEDTTLQKSKTMCTGSVYPEFELDNEYVPDIDPPQFPYYINRAKVRAFAELKQAQNQEAASETRRQKIVTQKRKRSTPDLPEIRKLPNYGRRN